MRVLVVDDVPEVAAIVSLYLLSAWPGVEVFKAENGVAALALFRQEEPDIVVLDLSLPDISGYEVIRRLRQQSAVPIVAITAAMDPEGMSKALGAGADTYMAKAFHGQAFVARVEAALHRRAVRQGPAKTKRAVAHAVDNTSHAVPRYAESI